MKDELLRQYQLNCLNLAKLSLMKGYSIPQNFTTKAISISEKGYRRIVKRLNQFLAEVSSIVHKDQDPADRVYQIDVQLFPNSKIIKREKK